MQTENGNNEGREAALNTYLNEEECTVARKYTNVYVLIYEFLYRYSDVPFLFFLQPHLLF